MPLYWFGFIHGSSPEVVEWHPDDVAALQAAATTTAELIRNREHEDEHPPMVMTFRVPKV